MQKINVELCYENSSSIEKQYALPLLIGRDPDCDLVLRSWRVARRHARILLRHDEIWLEDFGSILGTSVNGQRVAEYGPLTNTDEIVIGPCLLRFKGSVRATPQANVALAPVASSRALQVNLDQALESDAKQPQPADNSVTTQVSGALRQRLHKELITALQLRRRDITGMSDSALRAEATDIIGSLLTAESHGMTADECARLIDELVNEAVGLGPLEPLLADNGITEIMVNRHDEIYIERAGRLLRNNARFTSEQALLGVIERIVSPLGRRIDDNSPMVDARLKDGSRVNAVIAPVAIKGASLTIRKFPSRRLSMEDLLAVGALSEPMAEFLGHCVRHKKNIIVSGGTGSGKTSLLNILSNAIPDNERILTIEDAAELRLNHQHLVSLEARPANLEGRGRIEIRDLVRNALRMRPDRIVVGECRGAEAFDMLAAMNTGHEGSLTTLHANGPRDALARLEAMILMAGMDLPLQAIREHVAASIDFLVQLVRVADGRRLVSAIVQVTGIEAGRIQLQEVFLCESGPPARFNPSGLLPDGFTGAAAVNNDWFVNSLSMTTTQSLEFGR